MPMIYVSKKTVDLVDNIVKHLQSTNNLPSRIVKADVFQVALEEYAKKLGLRTKTGR
jgi:hypothetical protein